MNNKTLNYILKGLLILLGVLFIAGANQAVSLMEHRSAKLVNLSLKVQTLNNQKTQLIQDKTDITKYSGLNQIAESVVPQDKDQAETVQEIVNLAAQSGISQLSSITFPPSSLGGPTIQTSKGLTQVTPVKNIKGVYDLAITISQDNTASLPYNNFLTFLTNLEHNRRTALVSSVSVEPDPTNPSMVAFTIVVDEYIKP